MSDRTKVKIALAEAITTQLWVKGLITQKQREKINNSSQKALASNGGGKKIRWFESST